jgi:hypothetical protein
MKFVARYADPEVPGSGMLRRFPGKVAGIITTGHEEGASMAISSLFMTLNNYGMLFPPFSHVYAMSSVCNSTFEDKKIVTGECFVGQLRLLAENVLLASRLSCGVRGADWKYDSSEN